MKKEQQNSLNDAPSPCEGVKSGATPPAACLQCGKCPLARHKPGAGGDKPGCGTPPASANEPVQPGGSPPPAPTSGADALAALADQSTEDKAAEIEEVLAEWHREARVRKRERRELVPEPGKLYYKPELVPHANHPLVLQLGPKAHEDLLVQNLYAFSNFTEHSEASLVIPVSVDVSLGRLGLKLPDHLIAGALTVKADEGDHDLYTFDSEKQVERITGIVPATHGETPGALAALAGILAGLPGEDRALARLLYAVCLETIITGTLTGVPKDDRVVTAVRQNFDDHAADERRHHVYFAALFRAAWPQLSRRAQETLGPLLPRFLRLLLDPDVPAIRRALKTLPLSEADVEQVIAESYPRTEAGPSARASAKATLRLFKETGVLDLAPAREAFDELGLPG
jgi:hypothetical protein